MAQPKNVSALDVKPKARPELVYKVPPWKHQLEGIRRATDQNAFAFFFEVGTGKTMTAINTLRQKFNKDGILRRTLILSPIITLENWYGEWLMHSELPKSYITILSGHGNVRAKMLDEIKKRGGGQIIITNYEALLMPEVFQRMKWWKPEVLVCDESHRLKEIRAKRTKAAIMLADMADTRLLLTGTPVLNSPLDIFAQWRILDRGESFGDNFFTFRGQYFNDLNANTPSMKHFPNWQPKPGAVAEIHRLINLRSMQAKKSECLDLPPLVKKELAVEMSVEQKRHYKEMKNDLITYMNSGEACVATLAITKALRMMEICSGYITVEEAEGRKKVTIADNPRAVALAELLAEHGSSHKIIVWAVFKQNYVTIRKICDDLQLKYVEVHGEVSTKDKQDAVDAFQNDPAIRVFIGHPKSGGIGINLTASDISIVYSRSFSLEDDLQLEARNYRGGSERHLSVTRFDLVTKGTIDEEITHRLAAKQAVSMEVLGEVVKEL